MLTTTLNRIRECSPCAEGWEKLLRHLGKTGADDEPLPYATILDSNGLDDALWCCRAEPLYDREWRLYAVWCARQVQHLMTDKRSVIAIIVAERYALGQATLQELAAAWAAAGDAARDAGDAAWAAAAARAAARAAAAGAAAGDAARDAGDAARAAAARAAARAAAGDAAARAAAWAAAWDAARKKQTEAFLRIVSQEEMSLC